MDRVGVFKISFVQVTLSGILESQVNLELNFECDVLSKNSNTLVVILFLIKSRKDRPKSG